MNPITARLLNQQLCSPVYSRPSQVVSFMGAVQAQEYRLMRWAVCMRTVRPSFEAFREDFDSGKIIRLHLLRGTWQLIAAEDYGWMMDMFSARATTVIKGWMSANGISITEVEHLKISDIICLVASQKGSATKEDFAEALRQRNIVMDDRRLSYHIRMAELSGLLCNGKLLPMKASYSLVSEKVGDSLHPESDEALALLARKYFQSHSPATLEDFVWWSGLSAGICKKAINILGQWIHCVKFEGREFYVGDNCRTRGFRKGHMLLLPSYDEYLIGYKSRDLVLSEEYKHKAHNNTGNFNPIIVRDGLVCGNWHPFEAELKAELFNSSDSFSTDELSSMQKSWEAYRKNSYL